jgi:SAM-dependent methyltransferase
MSEFWDERFKQKEYVYGIQPNIFFAETIKQLKPGKLLLPMEGEGRNAVYAAKLGWEVTAFDYSKEGKRKAIELAKENNVQIDYHISEATSFIFPEKTFDAVGLIFSHLPPGSREVLHNGCVQALTSGGIIIAEYFHPDQLGYGSGGPKQLDMLYDAALLKNDFSELIPEVCEEKVVTLNEGPYHQGRASVVRYLGKKR